MKGQSKMDRFSEQLIPKVPDGKVFLIRGAIIALDLVVIAVIVLAYLIFGLGVLTLGLVAIIASVWLTKYLIDGTNIEYEYIVTNDDLDIDKIIGQRKRKRLITINLKTVTELEPYVNETELKADVTAVAHDGTGENLWYLISQTESSGTIALLFNPDERTRENIIGGLEHRVRAKYVQDTGENK